MLESRIRSARRKWENLTQGNTPAIYVGCATCGMAAGSGILLAAINDELRRLRVEAEVIRVGCIGACFAEPLVDIRVPGQPRVCYGRVTPEKLARILDSHVRRGKALAGLALGTLGDERLPGIPRIEDLPFMKSQVRVVTRNCGLIDPEDVDHYLARDGYRGLLRALQLKPEQVIEEVVASGLRGRGGGGFPTGQKWKFCRSAAGEPKYLICNGSEGDPGAFMDRSVLEGDPHSVLEGMCIAAYAIGASRGYVYVSGEYPLAIGRVKTALRAMRRIGLLGSNILGSGLALDIQVKEGAGAYVCGEETALMTSVEGSRGMPQPRPPFPALKGLWGKPTNINNVETFACVSNILREGASRFACYGTGGSKGTKTFSITGRVRNPGLIEVPMGIPLRQIVEEAGGGMVAKGRFKAAQTGGPSGGCIPAKLIDIPMEYESLAHAGSMLGSGGLVIMDESNCMVDLARYFLTFSQDESCGKCTPCRLGTKRMLAILERICAGRGRPEDIGALEELARTIKNTSLCGLGQTAPNPVLSTIRHFRKEYEEHIHAGRCRARVCERMDAAR